MKGLLIALIIVAVAIFTGTWIFDGLGWLFTAIGKVFDFLADILNMFGWNSGII
ncbi:MAG TPA: hypothetical protein IAB72_00195 [Candidatus Onthoplasma faecipullorum]|nr:hypothetical protein [Candidatus Onthoplasma faecipullorum]